VNSRKRDPAILLARWRELECVAPYFIASHARQKFCSRVCEDWGNRQHKLAWWNREGVKHRAKTTNLRRSRRPNVLASRVESRCVFARHFTSLRHAYRCRGRAYAGSLPGSITGCYERAAALPGGWSRWPESSSKSSFSSDSGSLGRMPRNGVLANTAKSTGRVTR